MSADEELQAFLLCQEIGKNLKTRANVSTAVDMKHPTVTKSLHSKANQSYYSTDNVYDPDSKRGERLNWQN